jgi:hypothetical protein
MGCASGREATMLAFPLCVGRFAESRPDALLEPRPTSASTIVGCVGDGLMIGVEGGRMIGLSSRAGRVGSTGSLARTSRGFDWGFDSGLDSGFDSGLRAVGTSLGF